MLALSTFPALVNTVYILNLREEMYDRDFEVAKKIQKSKSLSPILIGIEMKEKLREMGLGNGFSCLLNYGTTFVRRQALIFVPQELDIFVSNMIS